MKKFLCLLTLVFLLGIVTSCRRETNTVMIYTSSEDFRNEHFQKRLNEQFPQLNIIINYMTTGSLAAKLLAEGTSTDADIIGELESGYLEGLLANLADHSQMDTSMFLDEFVPAHGRYLPYALLTGSIILNEGFLAERNLPVPTSYQDLIRPEYRGVLTMPNPRSSGTGYFFLKNLINVMGEDGAFAYFDRFAENVLQFTSSGSGPVNALIQGEAGIGLGMTMQAVNAINTRGVPLRIIFFEEGSPYTTYGTAMVRGKDSRQIVKDVFQFWADTLSREDKELFVPGQIFKGQVNTIPNYPTNVRTADMRGIDNLEEKERLLARWSH